MRRYRLFTGVLVAALVAVPVAAFAQGGITVEVVASPSQACGTASFEVLAGGLAGGGVAPYMLTWDFDDGEPQVDADITSFPFLTSHDYGAAGKFDWTLTLTDASALTAETGGTLLLGPQVTLTSDVLPLLTLSDGAATLNFTAEVSGGEPPYTYAWDLDGDDIFEAGTETASHTYTAGGKYQAAVQVTDNCGLTATAVLTVVVVDPEAEACHPMAQRIADGVNSLFPTQAGQLYTCEDIFAIFQGSLSLTGNNLGFGRMWHAYNLAATLEDMTWEEILQWHLDGTGWGALVQLDRFAEALGDIGPGELVDMVLKGEASVGEIRTAVRMVTRYDADFVVALGLVHAGANPGEVGQIYRTASDLGLDLTAVQGYLEQGLSLPELRHAARVAEQGGTDLDTATQAHLDGLSWGEINQAMRLAQDGGDLSAILEAGVRETRRLEQLERQQEREQNRSQQQVEQDARTAAQLARRYGIAVEQVQALFDGPCAGDWSCVQTTLREQYAGEHGQGGRPK